MGPLRDNDRARPRVASHRPTVAPVRKSSPFRGVAQNDDTLPSTAVIPNQQAGAGVVTASIPGAFATGVTGVRMGNSDILDGRFVGKGRVNPAKKLTLRVELPYDTIEAFFSFRGASAGSTCPNHGCRPFFLRRGRMRMLALGTAVSIACGQPIANGSEKSLSQVGF